MNDKVMKLRSVFSNIIYSTPEDRVVSPSMSMLNDLRDAINDIFVENKCLEALYTLNTDKPFFGVKINPLINANDALVILSVDNKLKLEKYQIEIDSKLLDPALGLSVDEIVAYVIHEISSIMDSSEIFDNVRACIDANLVNNDDILSIRDSVNYAQLIIFAIKDTMYKLASILFKDNDEVLSNNAIQAFELGDDVISGKNKILNSDFTLDTTKNKQTVILQWMFTMYKSMQTNSMIVIDALKDAKMCTGSRLDINEIDKCLDAVERIDMSTPFIENAVDLNKFFEQKNMSSLNELSLFKGLKRNGLRTIEDDLYEFSMKVKNCTSADDAFAILRGINSRLGILEDYLATEKIPENEKNHWERVAENYRALRVELAKKKFKEKSWGVFIDYNALDDLDKKKDKDE